MISSSCREIVVRVAETKDAEEMLTIRCRGVTHEPVDVLDQSLVREQASRCFVILMSKDLGAGCMNAIGFGPDGLEAT